MRVQFTTYARPEPQGSMNGFSMPGKNGRKPRVVVTSANRKLKPYRQEVANTALALLEGKELPLIGRHVPVDATIHFFFVRPPSIPKKRTMMIVKPDLDKLARGIFDSLKGIVYTDDAQVNGLTARKHYGTPERVEITVESL